MLEPRAFFSRWKPFQDCNSRGSDAMFMRYDPQGTLVLSVRASFTEYNVPENYRWLEQKSSSATFLDGTVHLMHDKFKRSGPSVCGSTIFGFGWCYNSRNQPSRS